MSAYCCIELDLLLTLKVNQLSGRETNLRPPSHKVEILQNKEERLASEWP